MAMQAIYFVINTTGDEWECCSMLITTTMVYPEKGKWNIGGKLYDRESRHQKWVKKSEATKNQLRAIQKFEEDAKEFQASESNSWTEPEPETESGTMNAKHAQAQMFNNNTFSNGIFK